MDIVRTILYVWLWGTGITAALIVGWCLRHDGLDFEDILEDIGLALIGGIFWPLIALMALLFVAGTQLEPKE